MGPCAKTTVKCTLVTTTGEHIIGENWCDNPQPTCPRQVGEGYEKCKTICKQRGHAEAEAVLVAGDKARGAKAFIEGHTHACMDCQHTLFDAGVVSISVGAPPTNRDVDTKTMYGKDPVINEVLNRFISRADAGMVKYGTSMAANTGDTLYWLNHAIEEAMDLVNYLTRVKMELETQRLNEGPEFEDGPEFDGWAERSGASQPDDKQLTLEV